MSICPLKLNKFSVLILATTFAMPALAETVSDNDKTDDVMYVEGKTEYATGRVKGIVATRSMLATKSDIPLIKTPQSVSVITRDQMDLQNAASVSQALRYTSGVFTEYRGDSNRADEVRVRGFGYASRYLDGLNYSGTLNSRNVALNPWLLERVELIKGPSSALYGQSSPGGLIGMTSKRPTAETIRHVQVRAGNQRLREAAFDFGGAITDKILFRLNGIGTERDAQPKFVRDESIAIAPALTLMPSENTTFTLLTNYQKDPEANDRNFLPKRGTVDKSHGKVPYDFAISDPNFYKSWREQYSTGYALDHDFNDNLTFRQNLRYTKNTQRFKYMVYTFDDDNSNTSIYRRPQTEHINNKELTVDTRLESLFDTGMVTHNATLGFDYKWNRDDNQLNRASNGYIIDWKHPRYHITVPKAGDKFTAQDDNLQALKQIGIYLQDQLEIDKWNILLAGRYDKSKVNIKNRLVTGKDKRIAIDDNAFTTRLGVLYAFDNGISPYVSYSTSFQPNASLDINNKAFKPSKSAQIETGIKYQIPNSKTLLTAAIYHLNEKDVLTYDRSIWHNVQTGKVRSQGFEFEAHSELTPNIDLIASYSYADTEYKKTTVVGLKGNPIEQTPKHQASIWADYKFIDGALNGLSSGFGIRHTGSSSGFENKNNDYSRKYRFAVSSYTLYDWTLRYDFSAKMPSMKGLSLQVNANNLFNKHYVSSCAGESACFYGLERQVSAALNYDW
ncbi:TonB-dependent siderophore receptor [uncultured Gilliamella sp.]|jgi:TonB-dependent siderophore receptor|uniref:TonB-dependent siderophore receptor n=1 Tax=uncultured Gilliamella sp. TaxID=1193505 RepID=UPI0025FE1B3F|nr:TonB-dependent siderophore receptor [uncultured Gilliamella sp.]